MYMGMAMCRRGIFDFSVVQCSVHCRANICLWLDPVLGIALTSVAQATTVL